MNANLSESVNNNLETIGDWGKKHSPEICAVVTIISFGVALWQGIKAAPKAKEELETKKKELNTEKLPIKESAVIVAKNYWKTALPFAAGTYLTCKAADRQIKLQKYAVEIAADYSLAKAALREYKASVIETVGEKKAEKIQYAVDQKDLDNHPPVIGKNVSEKPDTSGNVVKTLIFEPQTFQYFWDNPDKFDAYVGRAIQKMSGDPFGEISLYDFLVELPEEVLQHIPEDDYDRLQRKRWTRDYPSEGFSACLGDSFTIRDPNSPFNGCACRRIVYDSDPIDDPRYY